MALTWKEHKGVNPFAESVGDLSGYLVYLAEVYEVDDDSIKSVIADCIEKSVTLLPENLNENSMYYLCGWDDVFSMLTIVVTDESKKLDSPNVVKCCFSGLGQRFQDLRNSSELDWEQIVNGHSEKVRDWIHNYLTTCAGFMDYSLVAAFHSKERSASELL